MPIAWEHLRLFGKGISVASEFASLLRVREFASLLRVRLDLVISIKRGL